MVKGRRKRARRDTATTFELEVLSILREQPSGNATVADVAFLALTSPGAAGRALHRLARLNLAHYDRMNPQREARWWPNESCAEPSPPPSSVPGGGLCEAREAGMGPGEGCQSSCAGSHPASSFRAFDDQPPEEAA